MMRILKNIALGSVLISGIGVHGQAVRRAASPTVGNTTAIWNSVTAMPNDKSAAPPSGAPLAIQDTVTVTRSVIVNPSPPPKTSPDQTVTVTKSITSAKPSTSLKPSSTPNPFKACWATGECKKALIDFTQSYNESGRISNPNEHDPAGFDQSHYYQRRLCVDRKYENVVWEMPADQRPMNFLTCMACFKQAGLDTNTQNSSTLNLMYKMDGFCHSNWPNTFDLFEVLYNFMLKSEAPTSIPELSSDITGLVPSLKNEFTWTSDMNRKTSEGDAPATTSVSTTGTDSSPSSTPNPSLPWLGSPLTPGAPLPTHLLEQIPPNWPYTEYGMLHRIGPIASMPLTDNSSQTVAWLYHSLTWNPRPLYTPPSARSQTGALYQPLLDSWTRTATWATTPGSAPRDAIRHSAPRDTTQPTASHDVTRPTSTQPRSQVSGAPTITQMPALPLEPDTPAES